MSEVTETTTPTQPEKEVTLDDVYRDAGLDKQTVTTETQVQREPVRESRVEPSTIPDPYDSEKFKAYMAEQATRNTAMQEATVKVIGFLNAQQQKTVMETTKADIDKAVSAINEVVGHPKPKVIEAALDGMVREDPRLKAIWDNRAKNPVAWSNAVKIVSKQLSEDFSMKVDPSLVTAQRARKEAQKSMATTAPEGTSSPLEEKMAAAQGAEFDQLWQQAVSGGH